MLNLNIPKHAKYSIVILTTIVVYNVPYKNKDIVADLV